jgi:hypothetical protein
MEDQQIVKANEQNDFVANKIPINEGELESYVLAVLEKAEQNLKSTQKQRFLDYLEEVEKHWEITLVYDKTRIEKDTFLFLDKQGGGIGEKYDIKYNVLAKKIPSDRKHIIICPKCENIKYLSNIHSPDDCKRYFSFNVDIQNSFFESEGCSYCGNPIRNFRYAFYEKHLDKESDVYIENTKEDPEIDKKDIIKKAISDLKKDLPPCGILNCDGSCSDHRHVVETKELTKSDENEEKPALTKKQKAFSLFGASVFVYLFAEFIMKFFV